MPADALDPGGPTGSPPPALLRPTLTPRTGYGDSFALHGKSSRIVFHPHTPGPGSLVGAGGSRAKGLSPAGASKAPGPLPGFSSPQANVCPGQPTGAGRCATQVSMSQRQKPRPSPQGCQPLPSQVTAHCGPTRTWTKLRCTSLTAAGHSLCLGTAATRTSRAWARATVLPHRPTRASCLEPPAGEPVASCCAAQRGREAWQRPLDKAKCSQSVMGDSRNHYPVPSAERRPGPQKPHLRSPRAAKGGA